VWRWILKGVCGGTVKLEAVRCGRQWRTTDAAFDDFLRAQTAAALSRGQHASDIPDADDAALEAAGLL